MSHETEKIRDLRAKVVLVGLPGCGKLQILGDWARRLGGGEVIDEALGDAKVYRADFSWPDIPVKGGVFELAVYTTSGEVEYSALHELLLDGVDGIVFVAPVDPSRAGEILESLSALGEIVSKQGRALPSLPFVLHYHFAEKLPEFNPQDLDDFLGIPPQSIPRVVTQSIGSPDLTGSLAPLLRRILEAAR